MNRSIWIKIGVALLVVAAVLIWRHFAIQGAGSHDSRIGQPAPTFTLPNSSDGREISLADYAGEPVILDFWSLTCPPCIEEMRHLRSMHNESDGEINILSINIDSGTVGRDARVKEMVESNQLRFPVLLDDGPTERAYDIKIMPTIFLVDGDGDIARVYRGVTESNVLRAAVQSASKR